MNKKDILNKFIISFTGSLDKDIYDYLEPASIIIQTNSKEILFLEDDPAQYIYYLASGNIKLSKITSDGKETIIKIVNPDEIFAEVILYGKNKYPVNAATVNKSHLLAVDVIKLKELCSKNPEFMLKIFVNMSMKMRYLVNMINDLSSSDASIRLLKYIQSLANKNSSKHIYLPVSKKDIAMLLGTAPETISRLLSKLQSQGVISIKGRNIHILKDINAYIK